MATLFKIMTVSKVEKKSVLKIKYLTKCVSVINSTCTTKQEKNGTI